MKTSKAKKYAIEQYLLQNEIIYLLNLHQEEGFYLHQIDQNKELQDRIMGLVPQIRKYFCHVNITGLLYPERCKRPWLSIVRGILRGRYYLRYRACRYQTGEGSVFTMRYFIEPTAETVKNTFKQAGTVTLNLQFRDDTDSLRNRENEPKKTLTLRKKSEIRTPSTTIFNQKVHRNQQQATKICA